MTKNIGSRLEVWNGVAQQTSGGLKKANLFVDARGCIRSKIQDRLIYTNQRPAPVNCSQANRLSSSVAPVRVQPVAPVRVQPVAPAPVRARAAPVETLADLEKHIEWQEGKINELKKENFALKRSSPRTASEHTKIIRLETEVSDLKIENQKQHDKLKQKQQPMTSTQAELQAKIAKLKRDVHNCVKRAMDCTMELSAVKQENAYLKQMLNSSR